MRAINKYRQRIEITSVVMQEGGEENEFSREKK